MKKYLIIKFVFFTSILFSQNSFDKEIFIDSLNQETFNDNFKYYRVIKNYYTIQNEYLISNYYKSGKIQMVGKSLDRDVLIKKGPFVYYFENGNKSELINFENSDRVGNYYSWYDNGEKKLVGEYLKNNDDKKKPSVLKIIQFWDNNCNKKVIDGYGNYTENEDDNTISNGKIKNCLKDSIWVGYNKNLKIHFSEEYKNGDLIFGTSTDSLGVKYNYKDLIIKPLPKKGVDEFYRFIGKNLKIPYEIDGLSGKLILGFTIEKDGQITNIKVIKSLSPKLDSNAIDLLYKYPKWDPGLYRGIYTKSIYSIPINIRGPN